MYTHNKLLHRIERNLRCLCDVMRSSKTSKTSMKHYLKSLHRLKKLSRQFYHVSTSKATVTMHLPFRSVPTVSFQHIHIV